MEKEDRLMVLEMPTLENSRMVNSMDKEYTLKSMDTNTMEITKMELKIVRWQLKKDLMGGNILGLFQMEKNVDKGNFSMPMAQLTKDSSLMKSSME
jgi:hypothetical protein